MKNALIGLLVLVVLSIGIWAVVQSRRPPGRKRGPVRDVFALAAPLFRPAISVAKSNVASRSYIGGAPPASPSLVWPTRDGHPLSLIACIDCSELPRHAELDWLPHDGVLLFFYDMINQPWGFDPKDRG